jgi:carbamoyl-phosphate synthase large subunit
MTVIDGAEELARYLAEKEISYPVLVDQFLPASEAEIDLAADGEHIVVPAIMEHIERTGVHSGDSLSMIPSQSLSEAVQKKIIDYASKIIKYTKYKGLMNIQYIIDGEEVFTLEINPRSSRTMPIVSKVTGVPLVNKATKILLGKYNLSKDEFPVLHKENSSYACVKYPVFSNFALRGLDIKTGPQMMSTGEGISIGATVEEAMMKYYSSLSNKQASNILLYTSADVEVVEEAAAYGVELVKYQGEMEELERVAGVFSSGVTEEDLFLRQWAITQRKLVFSQEETLKAYLQSKKACEWNVKPMGEWLSENVKGVTLQ